MISATDVESPRPRDDGLHEFRQRLAKVVLARLENELGSVSAHFGESYERGDDPEAVAYRKTGGAFRFLAFAFAPWRMWDLHVGTVPTGGSAISVGYHISVRAGPLLMEKLHGLARIHGIDVIHQPRAVEFQANLVPFDTSSVSAETLADTVCALCRRFAEVASEVPCPSSMRAGRGSPSADRPRLHMERRRRNGAGNTLHDDLVVFDGLLISRWGPEIFSQMRAGGLTAANCTCSVWENCQETLRNIGRWNQWFREHADRIVKARGVADIRQSKPDGRTAIVLGFQNVSAFEDQVGYVEIFKDAGVGIAQLAYNTQNLVGSGCYESTDSGLSDFGHDIVSEMNRVGIMCDLSHAGVTTARETILASKKPVCFSHCLPSALKPHPRNRTDEELRLVADHGGLVGVTMFCPFLAKGVESSLDDIIDAIAYVMNLVGEDAVGIGTDFTEGYGKEFFDWITHDKGYGRTLTEFGEIRGPEGFKTIADYGNLTQAMQRRGWSEARIRKVMGENWLRVLGEVWGG